MNALKRLFVALFRGSESGQSLVEYLIIVGACAFVGIAGFSRYGQSVKTDLGANARHIEGEGLPNTEGILGSLGADYNELPGWCVKPNYCFAAGTPVDTERGERAIESVRVGDRIWARDLNTGAIALRPVVNTYRTPNVPVVDLELSAGPGRASISSSRATIYSGSRALVGCARTRSQRSRCGRRKRHLAQTSSRSIGNRPPFTTSKSRSSTATSSATATCWCTTKPPTTRAARGAPTAQPQRLSRPPNRHVRAHPSNAVNTAPTEAISGADEQAPKQRRDADEDGA